MNRKHSILFVTLGIEGSGKLLLDLLRYADRSRYSVTILALNGAIESREAVPEWIPVVSGDYFATLGRRIVGTLVIARLCWSHDTIVTYAELTSTYMTILASLMALKRPVGGVHNHLSTIFSYKRRSHAHHIMIPLLYPFLRRVIACSDGVAEDLRNNFGLRNVISVPNSLDLERIREMAAAEVSPDFEPLFNQPVLITIGAMGFQKGHDILLRAFARVREAGFRHHLIIVGEGDDRELLALAAELGISEAVHMTGYVKNPYPLLKRSDAFVFSSRFEGFGLVLGEAMELQVPIVSTDCPSGPCEVLAHGACGLLVPVNDAAALARGIISILSDRNLADRFRDAGLAEIKRRDSKLWSKRFFDAIVTG